MIQKQTTHGSTGGCFVHRPISTPNRLILPFAGYKCFKSGPGLYGANRLLPKELEKLGVRDNQWTYFIEKLDQEVQKHSPSLFCGQFSCWIFVLLGLLGCKCLAENRYNKLLAKWLEEFNGQVLNSLGLYAKVQTNQVFVPVVACYVEYTEIISWLAISLNEEESIKLKEEPAIWMPECCCSKIIKPFCFQKSGVCWGPKRSI